MNLQEQQFDELMRHKLADYSEPPEMPMLDKIHTKKNRILKWYGLYRILVIASAVGLGLWGSIEAGKLMAEGNRTSAATETHTTQPNRDAETGSVNTIAPTQTLTQSTDANVSVSNTYPQTNRTEVANTDVSNSSALKEQNNPTKGQTKSLRNNHRKYTIESVLEQNKQQKQTPAESVKDMQGKANTTETKATPAPSDKKQETETSKAEEAETTTCNAAFEYFVSYNGEVNFNNFSNLNEGTEIKWLFGDGEVSTKKEPVHTYARGGTYQVTLMVKDSKSGCEQSISKRVTIGLPVEKQLLRLKGMVRLGGNPANKAIVEAMLYDITRNGYVVAGTTNTNAQGQFEFAGLENGRYLLKAYPISQSEGYMPTFWGNTANSEEAGEVFASEADIDLNGYTIDLLYQPIAKTDQPGNLLNDQPKTILLFDQNNQLVASVTADANGKFNFDGLQSGNYTAVDPSNGKSTQVDAGANGSISGNASDLVNDNGVMSDKVSVSPNPARDMVKVGFEGSTQELATIVIVNTAGIEIYKTTQQFNGGFNQSQLDVSSLAPGVYYVMIIRNNKKIMTSRLVKQYDNSK